MNPLFRHTTFIHKIYSASECTCCFCRQPFSLSTSMSRCTSSQPVQKSLPSRKKSNSVRNVSSVLCWMGQCVRERRGRSQKLRLKPCLVGLLCPKGSVGKELSIFSGSARSFLMLLQESSKHSEHCEQVTLSVSALQ